MISIFYSKNFHSYSIYYNYELHMQMSHSLRFALFSWFMLGKKAKKEHAFEAWKEVNVKHVKMEMTVTKHTAQDWYLFHCHLVKVTDS